MFTLEFSYGCHFCPVPFILLNHDHWLRASWSQGHLQEPLCFSMVFILVQLWSNDRMPFEFRSGRLFLPVTSLHFKLLLEMSVKKKKSPPGTPWTTPTSDFKKVGYIKLLGTSLCLTQRCREATLHPLGKTRNYTHPCPLPHLAQLQSVTEPSHLEETGSGFQAVLRWIWPYLANVSQAHGPAQVSSPPKRWFPYF